MSKLKKNTAKLKDDMTKIKDIVKKKWNPGETHYNVTHFNNGKDNTTEITTNLN